MKLPLSMLGNYAAGKSVQFVRGWTNGYKRWVNRMRPYEGKEELGDKIEPNPYLPYTEPFEFAASEAAICFYSTLERHRAPF